MININKIKIINFLAVFTILITAIILLGWIFDIGALKSILPGFVAMKYTTAICFFFSSLILLLSNGWQKDLKIIILPIACLTIFLIVLPLLADFFLKTDTGIESMLFREKADAVKTVTPGMPSIVTMINFILIGILALFDMTEKKSTISKIVGIIISATGALAIIGYLLRSPKLYYYIEGVTTAIALNTAILFVVLGVGFLLVGSRNMKKIEEHS